MPDEPVVFTGRKFRVVRLARPGRDGRAHPYEVIRHPGAAAIVAWLPDGRLLLVRQPRPAVGRELLEIPAGTLDPGEDAEVCARRELEEETGYRAARWRRLIRFHPSPGILDERMWLYEARDLAPGTPHPDTDEQITNVPIAPADIAGLVARGEIADAKTLVGLALVGIPLAAAGW